MSEKARLIIKKVAELYSYGNEKKTAEEVFDVNYGKLLDKEQEWDKAFQNYEADDVIMAVNNFWRYKSDKNRPNVAQILSILETEKEVVKVNHKQVIKDFNIYNIEAIYMDRDKSLGKLKYTLSQYRRAVNRIMNELLNDKLKELGIKIEDKDSSVELDKRYKKALELGLFNEFDEILDNVARETNFY